MLNKFYPLSALFVMPAKAGIQMLTITLFLVLSSSCQHTQSTIRYPTKYSSSKNIPKPIVTRDTYEIQGLRTRAANNANQFVGKPFAKVNGQTFRSDCSGT